jgi:hypothetical protein
MKFKKGHTPWNKGKKGLQISWNKGLTKDTDKRLKKMSISFKDKNNPMYGKVPWNKGIHVWKSRPHPRGMLGKTPWNKNVNMWKNRKHPKGMLGKRGYVPWNKGLNKESNIKIKEIIEKSRLTLIKMYEEKKIKPFMLGRKHSEETKRKISESEKELYAKGKIPYWLGKRNPYVSAANVRNWKNKEYREMVIKNTLKACMRRPTCLEKQMIEIINKYKLPYKYVGDGSFLIGYKNPDFVNTDGQKICIEVANKFHHDMAWARDRVIHFNKIGWKCFIFFEDMNHKYRLNEEQIIKKLVPGNKFF